MQSGGLSGNDEDTRTDDGADTEKDEVTRGKHAFEVASVRTRIDMFTSIYVRRRLDRMRRKKVFQHVSPLQPEYCFFCWDRRVLHGGHAAAPERRLRTIAQRGLAVQAAMRGIPMPCTRR
ncbi:hypothetical protein GCM10009552_25470 [Rothia nasimurium]